MNLAADRHRVWKVLCVKGASDDFLTFDTPAHRLFGVLTETRHNAAMAHVFIGIGSNQGDRQALLQLARKQLGRLPETRLVAWSPIYETEPVGPVPQGRFLNAAAELDSQLDPRSLLEHLKRIEELAGRSPTEQRIKWGPRALDLDILLYGDAVVSLDDLIVPHPLMHDRWFVLKPLADLNPGIVHPLLEMTVGELLKYLETASPDEGDPPHPEHREP